MICRHKFANASQPSSYQTSSHDDEDYVGGSITG